MLRTVYLHGPLAAKYGSGPVTFDADDAQTLLRGLNSAYPEFLIELRRQAKFALALKSDMGIEFFNEERLRWKFGTSTEVHLATQAQGAGFDPVSAFVATEVAAEFASAVTADVLFVDAVYYAAYIATTVAIAATLSAVAQSLAQKPSSSSPADALRSHLFDQAVNLEGQGHPIPLVYGKFRCGSVVISADVSSEKNGVAMPDGINAYQSATTTGNVFDNDIDGELLTLNSFVVGSTSYSAGATRTVAGDYTLTMTSTGDYTIVTSSFYGVVTVQYLATHSNGTKTSANLTITFGDKPTDHFGGSGDAYRG